MQTFGIDWVGVNADSGRKLLLSIIFIAILIIGGAEFCGGLLA